MQKNTKLRFGVVAAFAIAALAIGTAAPAYADPVSVKPLNGAGSDTTQDVMNGMAAVIPALGNWNAVPNPSSITVNGTTFSRPIGSTAGIRALSSSLRGNAYPSGGVILPVGTLNYARGSALRTNTATTELTYIPFARDAVTIAFNAASDFPRDVTLGVAGQATNQFTLRNIYLGTVTSFFDSTGNTITIRPILPQQLSGTREYWVLTALGTTEDLIAAGGRATDIGNTVQEHDGRFLTGPGDIVPFSVAQWVAQSNSSAAGLPAGVVPTPTGAFDRRGQAILGAIDTVVPLINVGNGTETNPDFLPSRIVYNIVATAALTTANPTATDTLIRQTFAGPTSLICQNAGVIRAYGFATISNCGNTSAQRGYVN